jgi:hypothetical protein
LPTLKISLEIVALFENIYDSGPILTVVSNIGEDVQYRCFNSLYDVKSVSHPGTIVLLGNNYSLKMIETGFAEQFYASHRDGACTNLFENFCKNKLKVPKREILDRSDFPDFYTIKSLREGDFGVKI